MPIGLPIVSKFDEKGVKDAELSIGGLQGIALGAFAKIGAMAVDAFASAARAAIDFGQVSIQAAIDSEAIARGMENAAKNSGAFGNTASDIKKATDALDKHSTKLAELTGYDDELFNKMKTGWLAVPSLAALGTNGINNLAKVTADVAAGTGKDLQSIALAFTKVAGDQETALGKLTRQGIVLSDQQKNTYNDFLAVNDEAGAQAYLIEQLGIKYAGAAEASASPLERMKVSFENLQEAIGLAFLPAIEQSVPILQTFMSEMVDKPEFQEFLAGMVTNFQNLLNWLPTALDNMFQFGKDALPAVEALVGPDGVLVAGLGLLASIFLGISDSDPASPTNDFAGSMKSLAGGLDSVTTALKNIKDAWDGLPAFLKTDFFGGIKWLINLPNPLTGRSFGQNLGWVAPTVPIQDQWRSLKIPGQATGGETTRSGLSMVGERGPELLNLPTGAQVIPLSKIGGGSGGGNSFTINVNAGMGADGAAIGEQIVTAIRKYERTSGAVFAKA